MKKYSIPFFANKKQCQKVIKLNEKVKEVYNDLCEVDLKELISNRFNAYASHLVIDEKGTHCSWHLCYSEGCEHEICTPNYVTFDMMTEETKKTFVPEVKEFSGPAIGEEFFVWEEGVIRKMFVDSYSVEIHLNGWSTYHITFHGENKKERLGHVADSERQMNQWIATYCRKSPDAFDSKFWSKEYKKMVKQKDDEYAELEKDYQMYKTFY